MQNNMVLKGQHNTT